MSNLDTARVNACWHCGASPVYYTETGCCYTCGRPAQPPVIGDPAYRRGNDKGPTWFGRREHMLEQIDRDIAAWEARVLRLALGKRLNR